MWNYGRNIIVVLVVLLLVEASYSALKCTTRSKRLRCAAKGGINANSGECRVPNIGRIINVTVKKPIGGAVCNRADFPLEAGASQAYTWNDDEVFTSEGCSAVFKVFYKECKTVIITRCKTSSRRFRCDKNTVCKVPKIDRIINATVDTVLKRTSCSKVAFPLRTDASGAWTWNGVEIHRTPKCKAVFKVFFERCTETSRYKCKTRSKPLRCVRHPDTRVCRVPKVDRIINATVHEIIGDTVCNRADFPLEVGASQSYTWNADEITTTFDCSAVFNVYHEKCKKVTGKCIIHGDPHVTTADGFEFTLIGAPVPCYYYLVKHKIFSIMSWVAACYKPDASCLRKIKISFKKETIVLDQDGGVTDGTGKPFVSSKKIDVIESDNRVEVVFLKGKARGVTLTWNRKANAEILLPKRLMRKIDGFCGDFDGHADNDSGASTNPTQYLVDRSCPAYVVNGP